MRKQLNEQIRATAEQIEAAVRAESLPISTEVKIQPLRFGSSFLFNNFIAGTDRIDGERGRLGERGRGDDR